MLLACRESKSKSYRMNKMKWIEILELRSTGSTRKQLEKHIQELIDQSEKKSGQPVIKIYTRLNIGTDLSIHLIHDANEANNQGSTLGLSLVSELKSYGLVNHTIWIEKQKDL